MILNFIFECKFSSRLNIRPPHSVAANHQIALSAAGTPVDLKKYGTTNFIGFNKMKKALSHTKKPSKKSVVNISAYQLIKEEL